MIKSMGVTKPAVAGVLMWAAIFGSTGSLAAERSFISIGTGSVTGVYYPAGGAICHLINKNRDHHDIRCTVESSDGSRKNVENIVSGIVDFGIVQSDIQYNALNGTSGFEGAGPAENLRAVMSLHYEAFTVVARADSNMLHIQDTKGIRMNIGNPGSGQRETMAVVMKALGWTEEVFSEVYDLKASEQSNALCNGTIDAMVYIVGHPNASIREAFALCKSVMLDVSGPEIDRLISENEYYSKVSMPGGLYRGDDGSTQTFGLSATVMTRASTSDENVYEMVKAVFENLETFRNLHPAFASLDPSRMVREGLSAPLHPGALRYYREAGLID